MSLGARVVVGLVSISISLAAVFVLVWKSADAKKIPQNTSSSVQATPTTDFVQTITPKVISVSPEDGAQDVSLDIEDPIIVRFDVSTKDSFVDFRFDPPMDVAYQNNVEKTEFRLLPKESLTLATAYTLGVFVKSRGADDVSYRQTAKVSFSTPKEKLAPGQQAVADKLSDAKRSTVAQITQGRYIDITLSNQVMVLFEDGKPIDAYLVSSGKRGMDTPKGSFTIRNKSPRAFSKTYGLYMPNWMAIEPTGKFGIHELPEWPSGYKEGASHLGIPVSHGCVRLGVGPARRVFDWTDLGTPVIVH